MLLLKQPRYETGLHWRNNMQLAAHQDPQGFFFLAARLVSYLL